MKSTFDAIIFDLGGVILNIDYQKTISQFKNIGISNFDSLYTQAQQNHVFDNFETGRISPQAFRDYIKEESNIQLSDLDIDAAWNAMLLDLPQKRIACLEQLAKTYPIFLYSNTNQIHLESFRDSILKEHGQANLLEDLFVKTYYSHEIQKRKPNAEGFLQILNENGLKAENTLFIDDSEQHIIGAQKIGLQTIWLTDKEITDLF